jgi:hypothetical protein
MRGGQRSSDVAFGKNLQKAMQVLLHKKGDAIRKRKRGGGLLDELICPLLRLLYSKNCGVPLKPAIEILITFLC